MFTTKLGFRALVVASVVLGVLSGVVDVLFPSLVPSELQTALEQLEAARESNMFVEGGFAIALLLAGLVSTVGLLVFWKPARLLYVASFLASYVFIGMIGPHLSSGPSETVALLSEFLAGVVAALMYTQPIGAYFEKSVPSEST